MTEVQEETRTVTEATRDILGNLPTAVFTRHTGNPTGAEGERVWVFHPDGHSALALSLSPIGESDHRQMWNYDQRGYSLPFDGAGLYAWWVTDPSNQLTGWTNPSAIPMPEVVRDDSYREDVATIYEALMDEAERRDWCSDFGDFVRDLSGRLHHPLPEVPQDREVTIEVTVSATNDEDSVREALEAAGFTIPSGADISW